MNHKNSLSVKMNVVHHYQALIWENHCYTSHQYWLMYILMYYSIFTHAFSKAVCGGRQPGQQVRLGLIDSDKKYH